MSGMFERAVELVLAREGVLSDDRHDPGGLTKYGISQKAYPDLDIASLTRADAIAIYRRDYWDACRCGDMPWWAALLVFDCAVNQGPGVAKRVIQQAVGVAVDGKIGPATLAAIKRADSEEATAMFQALRALRYADLPTWERYGKGWMRRAHLMTINAATQAAPAPAVKPSILGRIWRWLRK